MMKRTVLTLIIICSLLAFLLQGFGQEENLCEPGDTTCVNDDTIASVVRLGKIVDRYLVSGMPAGHVVTVDYGVPNFGGGRVLNKDKILFDLGSGVIVSENGWIFTNAHVADDWTADSIGVYEQGTDDLGNPLYMVTVPAEPGYMWVTVASIEDVKNSIRRVELKYLCQTLYYDSDYANFDRDRAVCKIIAHAQRSSPDALPEVTVKWDDAKDKVPMSDIGNPFDIPIRKPDLTAMGFPGIGSQTFHTISEGEFLSYDRVDRSYILHAAFISGGNSGGGLFYNDRLIGINTWDRADARGRNVSIAQPITYFAKSIASCKLWYEKDFNVTTLPDIPREWVEADPGNDPYKNEVYIGFNIRSQVNENVAVKSGFLVAFKTGVTAESAFNYLGFRDYLDYYYLLHYFLSMGYGLDVIAPYLQLNMADAQAMANMTEQELMNSLDETTRGYLDIYNSGEFYANYWYIDEWGQSLAAVPPNIDVNIYVMSDGFADQQFNYKSTNEMYQGPYLLKMPTM
jgi:S1-C subfamily serine protease